MSSGGQCTPLDDSEAANRLEVVYIYALHKNIPYYISRELELHVGPTCEGTKIRKCWLSLQVEEWKKEVSDLDFSINGPHLCNTLPSNIRLAPSLDVFRKRLKTHFF